MPIGSGSQSLLITGAVPPRAVPFWMNKHLHSKPRLPVRGPCNLYWKVSSEANYDFLRFYLDSADQDAISGTVDWQQKTYTIPTGTHTIKWQYSKDYSVNTGSDCSWVDRVIYTPAPAGISLNTALDNHVLSFTCGGSANWLGQSTTSYYGGSAAQSGTITDNQSSSFQATVTGPGPLSFYWRVSSEANYDYLKVYIDNILQDQISGNIGWQQKSILLPPAPIQSNGSILRIIVSA